MSADRLPVLPPAAEITPLRNSSRVDVAVPQPDQLPDQADWVRNIRQIINAVDREADRLRSDPVALTQAKALVDTLKADWRELDGTISGHLARTLREQRVRRLTVEGVATVEASSRLDRTNWDDRRLLHDMLKMEWGSGAPGLADAVAETVLRWLRPSWRLTAIRDAGLDPDDYSTTATVDCELCNGEGIADDLDGQDCPQCGGSGEVPDRQPAITVRDNRLRQ